MTRNAPTKIRQAFLVLTLEICFHTSIQIVLLHRHGLSNSGAGRAPVFVDDCKQQLVHILLLCTQADAIERKNAGGSTVVRLKFIILLLLCGFIRGIGTGFAFSRSPIFGSTLAAAAAAAAVGHDAAAIGSDLEAIARFQNQTQLLQWTVGWDQTEQVKTDESVFLSFDDATRDLLNTCLEAFIQRRSRRRSQRGM